MEIREATEGDIPKIVGLLKVSLGEDLMPKSEEYWKWKHVDNPFGASPVLLCWEGNELIGVRAFMRWEWINNGKVYRALRAVDTATHPDHQGKGIFKRLTLALVDHCKARGDDFIFNTPNSQSKPGYLKMGWSVAGELPIKVSVTRPLRLLQNLIAKPSRNHLPDTPIKHYLSDKKLDALLEDYSTRTNSFVTNISAAFLKWRYIDVPVAKYVAIAEEQHGDLEGLIIARLKDARLGLELRITDFLHRGNVPGKVLIEKLNDCKRTWRIDYCTISGTSEIKGLKFGFPSLRVPFGPVVTIRNLGLEKFDTLRNFNNWSPSLGDLELF